MKVRRVLGPKGQIVIPKDIREYLGLKPGSPLVLEAKEGELIIRPDVDPERFVEEFCSIPGKKLDREIDLKKIYEEQLEKRLAIR